MTDFNFEALGLKPEDIEEKIVERAVEKILSVYKCDFDDGAEWRADSLLSQHLSKGCEKRMDELVSAFITKVAEPHIAELVESASIRQTNSYGEKKGKTLTFTEYIVKRVDEYLDELVGEDGKRRDSYTKNARTRIDYLIDTGTRSQIEDALKDAREIIRVTLEDGLQKSLTGQLMEMVSSIKLKVVAK